MPSRATRDPYPELATVRKAMPVQAPQQHGVDMQEVAGKDAVCLGGQELPPGR
jgi:hypothetical protein